VLHSGCSTAPRLRFVGLFEEGGPYVGSGFLFISFGGQRISIWECRRCSEASRRGRCRHVVYQFGTRRQVSSPQAIRLVVNSLVAFKC
jgi:hypothetical protein